MKIAINTKLKTIEISGEIVLSDLITFVEGLNIKDYKIITKTEYITLKEYVYIDRYPQPSLPTYPWINPDIPYFPNFPTITCKYTGGTDPYA